jgi:hypothetical protein
MWGIMGGIMGGITANFARESRTLAMAVFVVIACLATPARAAVTVAITPANGTVTPGTDFDLFVDVTASGSEFNGFEMVVEFDPAALTLVPLAPTTLQQGCLMTGSCSGACGNTFHQFAAAGDSLKVNDVLLCNMVSLAGPGRLYTLRFHASSTPQATIVKFRRMRFYNAGLFVQPVNTTNAVVGIGVNVGVGDVHSSSVALVRAEPNPSRGAVAFVATGGLTEAASIEVLDLQGRLLRRLGSLPASGQPLQWDGTDARGSRVPPGVYLARIHLRDRIQNLRLVLLP